MYRLYFFQGKPFVVLSFGESIENIFNETDPFPCDLPDDEIVDELKEVFDKKIERVIYEY